MAKLSAAFAASLQASARSSFPALEKLWARATPLAASKL
jgi:hypothetical protein